MKLYIIRHGQTDWNVVQRIQGSQDIPLNEQGRRQAGLLAKAMEERPVEKIFASPQLRAYETARIVGERQHVPVVTVPWLMEINYGVWEGRTSEEILSEDGALYSAWLSHPSSVAPRGGETLKQVDDRCEMAWEQIKSQAAGDIAIVSHGGTLAHLIALLLKKDRTKEEMVVGNASITTIDYDPEARVCRLLELDDCSHLL